MAKAQQTSGAQAWSLEPEKLVPKRRLQRALAEPEILDEFLVNPEDVADRYEVSLNEDEIKAVRNASRFLASWDLFCGNGQWLANTRFDGGVSPSGPSIADATVDAVQARVADEILQALPRTIRQIVSEIGSDVLVDPDENIEHLPEHVQPLARTFRRFARTMARGVTRELSQAPGYPAGQQVGAQQQQTGGFPQQMVLGQANGPFARGGNGISGLGQALAQYLQQVVNHATREAMEHIRPEFSGQTTPRWRQTTRHGDRETVRS